MNRPPALVYERYRPPSGSHNYPDLTVKEPDMSKHEPHSNIGHKPDMWVATCTCAVQYFGPNRVDALVGLWGHTLTEAGVLPAPVASYDELLIDAVGGK